MNPKVSVIVPVYNVQEYLHQCVDSILTQTFTDFELLLIDDGSSDGSVSICDEYASIDSRVRVFHKSNGGVSSARNLGLDYANGEWIIFCDSDDLWVDTTFLGNFTTVAEQNNLDIIRGEFISIDEYGHQREIKNYSHKQSKAAIPLNSAEFLHYAVSGDFYLVLCLIRRECIGSLRFDVHQVFLEDMKFFMLLMSKEMRCYYWGTSFYAYRKSDSTASNRNTLINISDALNMTHFFWKLSDNSQDPEFRKFCEYYSIMMYFWTIQTISRLTFEEARNVIIDESVPSLYKLTRHRMKLSNIKINGLYKYLKRFPPLPSVAFFKVKFGLYSLRIKIWNILR